jgi:GrpB-like predicted nucleotidyltransferase (UPF0157 family)
MLDDLSNEPVLLAQYDTCWTGIFQREAEVLRRVLSAFGLRAVEHIGSTAVRGMTAKPIVDIVGGAGDIARMPRSDDPIWASAGYVWGHAVDDQKWLYFVKRDSRGKRVAQLHVVPFEGDFWNRVIAFRDALRSNAALAQQYESLKIRLAAAYGHDRIRYRDEKAQFISDVIAAR